MVDRVIDDRETVRVCQVDVTISRGEKRGASGLAVRSTTELPDVIGVRQDPIAGGSVGGIRRPLQDRTDGLTEAGVPCLRDLRHILVEEPPSVDGLVERLPIGAEAHRPLARVVIRARSAGARR